MINTTDCPNCDTRVFIDDVAYWQPVWCPGCGFEIRGETPADPYPADSEAAA